MAKEYKSVIKYADGILEFLSNKWSDWDSFKVELKRSATYKGLVSSFTSSMTYVKTIRDEMVIAYDKYGPNADASLSISISNKNGERNSYTQVGDNQYFSLDFSKAEITENSISLNAEDSSFSNKFFSRHKEKIDFDQPTNLDGGEMSDYKPDLDTIFLHDRTLQLNNETKTINNSISTGSTTSEFIFIPALSSVIGSDDDIKNTVSNIAKPDSLLAENYLLLQSEQDKPVDLNLKGSVYIGSIHGDYELAVITYDSNFEEVPGSRITQPLTINVGFITEILFNNTLSLSIKEGQSLAVGVLFTNWDTFNAASFFTYTGDALLNALTIKYSAISFFEQTTAKCIKPLRGFRRLIEAMTGDPDAVYSNLFGLESEGYEQDGEWANLVTLNGKLIRGFDFGTFETSGGDIVTTTYNVTFEDLFKYYNSIEPLSLAIENVNGKQRVRIEKYNDLYENGIIIKLGTNINELVRQVRTDALFTTIIGGYKDQKYEELSGLESSHGEINFTSPLKVKDKKYDIKCKARAGDIDIELVRRYQIADTATTDTRYDKDNYLIDAYISGDNLLSRRDELFSSITGIFNPQYIYNARLLPARNVRRHGGIIKESLNVNNDDLLVYTKGSNNPNVTSQLLTESKPVIEKSDIPISELQRPKVLAELLSFNTPLALTEYNLINLNKNKLITFVDIGGKEISGYIESLEFNEPKGEAEMVLIRANR